MDNFYYKMNYENCEDFSVLVTIRYQDAFTWRCFYFHIEQATTVFMIATFSPSFLKEITDEPFKNIFSLCFSVYALERCVSFRPVSEKH